MATLRKAATRTLSTGARRTVEVTTPRSYKGGAEYGLANILGRRGLSRAYKVDRDSSGFETSVAKRFLLRVNLNRPVEVCTQQPRLNNRTNQPDD